MCTDEGVRQTKNGMMNIDIEGTVRRKSRLSESKNGSYFHFYLYDNQENSIFKEATETFTEKLEESETYHLSRINV